MTQTLRGRRESRYEAAGRTYSSARRRSPGGGTGACGRSLPRLHLDRADRVCRNGAGRRGVLAPAGRLIGGRACRAADAEARRQPLSHHPPWHCSFVRRCHGLIQVGVPAIAASWHNGRLGGLLLGAFALESVLGAPRSRLTRSAERGGRRPICIGSRTLRLNGDSGIADSDALQANDGADD
jgi:hypothetical protein